MSGGGSLPLSAAAWATKYVAPTADAPVAALPGARPVSDLADLLRPFIAILGVPLGFALGQWDSWRRGRREAWGARMLLRLEIDDNLDEVRRYRAEAADRALEEMLPPAWQREAWASQLARLPAALSPIELARVRRFYARLDLVAEHHQRARTAANDPFIQAREVAAAEELTRDLDRDGNPLAPRRGESRRRRALTVRTWSWKRDA